MRARIRAISKQLAIVAVFKETIRITSYLRLEQEPIKLEFLEEALVV